jgi:hypothetical protein
MPIITNGIPHVMDRAHLPNFQFGRRILKGSKKSPAGKDYYI